VQDLFNKKYQLKFTWHALFNQKNMRDVGNTIAM